MPNKAQTSQLLISPTDNDRYTTNIYIAEPTPLEEKNFGTIFSIIDIESTDDSNEEVIGLINEELTQNYYRSSDLEIEIAFENTLNILNRKLQEVIKEMGEEWLKKVNACIGIIKEKELHFTQIGNINILLTQKDKVIKLNEPRYETPNPLKIFANISSGQLTMGASMFFCTESILDYISQEKIKKTLHENNPEETKLILKDLLHENSNATNFGAIIIKMLPQSTNAIENNNNISPINKQKFTTESDSMQELVTQQNTTDELLSPSLWPGLKNNIAKITNSIKPVKSKNELTPPSTAQTPTTNGNNYIVILMKILTFLKNILLQLLSGILWLIRKIPSLFKNRKQYSSKFHSLPDKTGGVINKTINWFRSLSTPRKALIILLITILFVFSQSIIRQGKKQEEKQEIETYEQSIIEAGKKLGEAESKILMNDTPGARTLVNEASQLLKSVPEDSKTWEEKGTEQSTKLAELQDKVNLVNRVDQPLRVANYSNIDAQLPIDKITLIGSNVFAFNQDSNAIYRYELGSNEATTSISATGDAKIISQNKDSAATVLAIQDDQTFVQFNPVTESLTDIDVPFENQDLNIIDIKTFGSRLYSLDIKNNQIYKNTKSGDEYGDSSAWLEDDEVDLKNAVSFAIDGAVYILKDNGNIIKLFSGVEDNEWSVEALEPNLDGATKIYTDEDTVNIYILDPANQRMVILNKDGELDAQYASNSWTNLKDMFIDEINNTAYVLNDLDVFEINL